MRAVGYEAEPRTRFFGECFFQPQDVYRSGVNNPYDRVYPGMVKPHPEMGRGANARPEYRLAALIQLGLLLFELLCDFFQLLDGAFEFLRGLAGLLHLAQLFYGELDQAACLLQVQRR